tara:strand:+ start:1155 stop:1490 length:336 start_codon:yes stop_codon:yes gene_type:complete
MNDHQAKNLENESKFFFNTRNIKRRRREKREREKELERRKEHVVVNVPVPPSPTKTSLNVGTSAVVFAAMMMTTHTKCFCCLAFFCGFRPLFFAFFFALSLTREIEKFRVF